MYTDLDKLLECAPPWAVAIVVYVHVDGSATVSYAPSTDQVDVLASKLEDAFVGGRIVIHYRAPQ